jgi:hypothetical protein
MAMMRKAAILGLGLAMAAGMTGCRVHVDKSTNGEQKHVQVDTPFGGVHVNTNQTTATDLGLPAYPGAVAVNEDKEHKSADVHVGFGEWQLRVRAASYATSDSEEKVTAFYRQALGRYGDVIACQGNAPVGTPTQTSEGLTCSDQKGAKVRIGPKDYGVREGSLELKAGSKRHQHIVGFEKPKEGQTRFVLVALDLPFGNSGDDKGVGKSD